MNSELSIVFFCVGIILIMLSLFLMYIIKRNIKRERIEFQKLKQIENEKIEQEENEIAKQWENIKLIQIDLAKEQQRRDELDSKTDREIGIEANIKIERLTKIVDEMNNKISNIKSYTAEMEQLSTSFVESAYNIQENIENSVKKVSENMIEINNQISESLIISTNQYNESLDLLKQNFEENVTQLNEKVDNTIGNLKEIITETVESAIYNEINELIEFTIQDSIHKYLDFEKLAEVILLSVSEAVDVDKISTGVSNAFGWNGQVDIEKECYNAISNYCSNINMNWIGEYEVNNIVSTAVDNITISIIEAINQSKQS